MTATMHLMLATKLRAITLAKESGTREKSNESIVMEPMTWNTRTGIQRKMSRVQTFALKAARKNPRAQAQVPTVTTTSLRLATKLKEISAVKGSGTRAKSNAQIRMARMTWSTMMETLKKA